MSIFDKATIAARRQKLSQSLTSQLKDGEAALFFCGEPVTKPGGLDQTYDFLPHPEYYWLTGLRRAFGVVAFERYTGWRDFVLQPTVNEALWEGGRENEEVLAFGGSDVSAFEPWLKSSRFKHVFAFGQPTPDMRQMLRSYGMNVDDARQTQLQELINRARRPKDQAEIALVKRAAEIANVGYEKLAKFIRAGVSEREIQLEYESDVLRAGAQKFPYGTIVGAGSNAAVLHAVPTSRIVKKDELVLIDAGADLDDYCVDITRVFSSSGKFTSQQQALYDLVMQGQAAAIESCRVGVEWREVHRKAATVMAEGLRDLNVLHCDAQAALETEAISVFFPHGVGHLVGQRVRDVGGVAGKPVERYCGVRLRVDLPLEEGFLVTVEPGLYFVDALLSQPETRKRFAKEINWHEVEKWREIGGVRIEDDILITRQGPQNLTSMVAK